MMRNALTFILGSLALIALLALTHLPSHDLNCTTNHDLEYCPAQ